MIEFVGTYWWAWLTIMVVSHQIGRVKRITHHQPEFNPTPTNTVPGSPFDLGHIYVIAGFVAKIATLMFLISIIINIVVYFV